MPRYDPSLASPGVRCAVAFLGQGTTNLFERADQAKIVCNLASGATNPQVISALLKAGHDVRQHDRLHAKVYLCSAKAVVASANLSANGLGLEATEQAHWIEAGIVTTELGPIKAWFDGLWASTSTRPITKHDLNRAFALWRKRRSHKPLLQSFADFNPDASDAPLLYAWEDVAFELNKHTTEAQTGLRGDDAWDVIGNSMHIADEGDMKLMSPGAWVLWWKSNADGTPSARGRLAWGRCGQRVKKVWREPGSSAWMDAVLNDMKASPPPFDCNERRFITLFRRTLSQDCYADLRGYVAKGPFLVPRRPLERRFWRELSERYRSG